MDSEPPQIKPIGGDGAVSLSAGSAASALDERGSVTLSAAIFAFGTFLSRCLGLVRDMMTARYFPNDLRDAFIYAFRLPNLFRRLLGEGSLSISFIPIFVEILSGKGSRDASDAHERAKSLVAGVFSILLSVSITLSLISILFMDEILRFLLSGEAYLSVPGKFELTVRLARIMFGFLVLISIYAFLMAILNSFKKFVMPALAPCFFNIAMISAAVISPSLAAPEEVLAWSVILGGVLQMGVLIPGVWRLGYFPRPTLKIATPEVGRVLKAILPGIFGLSLMQLTTIVNMHFTSKLQSGAQSYLYFADRILELPLSMIVVSVSSALLPSLAKYWSDDNKEAMSETLNHYIRLILFIAIPAAIGMFFLARPIVSVLFLGKEFKYADAMATAQVIQVYAFTVVVAASVRILAQGFYAIQNTWFPALAGGVALCTHVFFAYALTNAFGLNGLAAASLCSATVNLLMLITAYKRWVGTLRMRDLSFSVGKFLVCGLAMASVLLLHPMLSSFLGARFYMRALALAIMVFAGASVYMLAAHLLRIPEYHETLATFTNKFKSKLKRV